MITISSAMHLSIDGHEKTYKPETFQVICNIKTSIRVVCMWFMARDLCYYLGSDALGRNDVSYRVTPSDIFFISQLASASCVNWDWRYPDIKSNGVVMCIFRGQLILLGLALLTLSWDRKWDSHSLVNGYPSFYPRIALVAPSPGR